MDTSMQSQRWTGPITIVGKPSRKFCSLQFNANSTLLGAAGNNGVHIWNIAALRPLINTLDNHRSLGEMIIWAKDDGAESRRAGEESKHPEIKMSARFIPIKSEGGSGHYAFSFSPNGEMCVSSFAAYESLNLRAPIGLWQVSDATLRDTLRGHLNTVWRLAFNSDGSLLASGDALGFLRIWSIPQLKELHLLKAVENPHRDRDQIKHVAFSRKGYVAATGDHSITIWNARAGKKASTIRVEDCGFIYDVAFSPDGTLLACQTGKKTLIWRVDTSWLSSLVGKFQPVLVCTIPEPGGPLGFSPDGKALALSGNNSIRIIRIPDGELLCTLTVGESVNEVAFSPDGTLLAVATERSGDGSVLLWKSEQ